MDFPDFHIPHNEGVLNVGAGAVHSFAVVEAVQAVAVRFVIVEADKGKRANVHGLALTVGLLNPQFWVETATGGRLETEAVTIVFARDVLRETIQTICPPETSPFIGVEREYLFRQRFRLERLDGQISIEDVVDLRAVFEKVSVPDALIADAIAHDQVIRSMNRQPTVGRIPNRSANHGAAAHRIAAQMIVQAVAAER